MKEHICNAVITTGIEKQQTYSQLVHYCQHRYETTFETENIIGFSVFLLQKSPI